MAYVIKVRTLMVCKSATANALLILGIQLIFSLLVPYTVKLGNKELFNKEQIGIKEPFPVINLSFTS